MRRLGSTADEIRALVPEALESWAYIRENVLERGVVDQRIKDLCFRYLANDPEVTVIARFNDPERAALEWADAIAHDSDRAVGPFEPQTRHDRSRALRPPGCSMAGVSRCAPKERYCPTTGHNYWRSAAQHCHNADRQIEHRYGLGTTESSCY